VVVNDRDRAHWKAVREAFEADAAARIEDAERLTPEERIRIGLRLGNAHRDLCSDQGELERLAHEKTALHRRWRSLQERRRDGRS
jgi:hypothetical protein